MPHVSSRKLKKQIFVGINKHFVRAIADLKSSKDAKEFVDELLTDTEKIMLAKRLAIIYMISKGYSFGIIQKALKVTPATVDRIKDKMKHRSYGSIVRKIKQSERGGGFWCKFGEFIADFIDAMFVPHGRGRWSHMRNSMYKRN